MARGNDDSILDDATVSVNGGPRVPLDTLEQAMDDLEARADAITGTKDTLGIGFRALAVTDAFPEETDRDIIHAALVLFAQACIATGKSEQKINNDTSETTDKLIRIKGETDESGKVVKPGLLKLVYPKRDIPEFLTKLVLDRQLTLF